jgi:general secretion pathway protein I
MTAGNQPLITSFDRKGFTLLEVMVSIMVLAVVLVTLFRLHAGTIRLTENRKIAAVMPLVAQYQLSRLEAEKPEPGSLSGSFPDEMDGFEWSCMVENAEFTDPVELSDAQSERLKKITLEITAPGSDRSWLITTWRYLVEDDDE